MSADKETKKLRKQLDSLIQEARRNEETFQRFRDLELALMRSNRLDELIERILSESRDKFQLDRTVLVLEDPEHEIRRLTLTDEGEEFHVDGLITVDSLQSVGIRPFKNVWLGPYDHKKHHVVFKAPKGELHSIAVLPLMRDGQTIGILGFGSLSPTRFEKNSSTDFLEYLATVTATSLSHTLDHERVIHLSLTDTLTAVNNRRFFDQRFPEEVSRAIRHRHPISLMFLDLDYFKKINDTYGHEVGDLVLREAANLIKTQLRTSDLLARYGGEEFIALLPHADAEEARTVAERIRTTIELHCYSFRNHPPFNTTISIGCTTFTPEDDPSRPVEVVCQNLVQEADKALYDAKEGGRNRAICLEHIPTLTSAVNSSS